MRTLMPLLLVGGIIGAIFLWPQICPSISNAIGTNVCLPGNAAPLSAIEQAAQDAIAAFKGTGNPGQGALNSGSQSPGIKKELDAILKGSAPVVPFTALPQATQQAQLRGDVAGINDAAFTPLANNIAASHGSTDTGSCGFIDGGFHRIVGGKNVGACYARSNLAQASLYRMSIG